MVQSQGAVPASVPVALRVGGGFVALALVLLVFGFFSVMSEGWMGDFAVTLRFLIICGAAVLVGAFVTTSTKQRGSLAQVIGLASALALVIISRFTGTQPLVVIEQYWIFMYAVAALLCALVIRRSMIPKD